MKTEEVSMLIGLKTNKKGKIMAKEKKPMVPEAPMAPKKGGKKGGKKKGC
jgi:hypothetical protein